MDMDYWRHFGISCVFFVSLLRFSQAFFGGGVVLVFEVMTFFSTYKLFLGSDGLDNQIAVC